jgi:hypothetical protein
MTTLPDLDTARRWRDLLLVPTDGAAVGLIEGIYVDVETGRPEWALVGLDADGFTHRTFVPLAGAGEDAGRVRVPCEREQITGAPRLPASGTLSRLQETRLYDHYGIAYSTAASPSVLPAAEADPSDLDHPMADDELDGVGSSLDTGAGTAGARAAVASEPPVTPGRELVEVPPARGRGRLAGGALALAGLAGAGGLAAVVRRRRGSGSGVRAEVTRQMDRSKRKVARAGRRAEQASGQLAGASARVAKAAAKTAEAAARQAARTAEKTSRRAARQAARTAEKTSRRAAGTAERTRRKASRAAEDAGRRAARARRKAAGATSDAVGAATRTAGTVAAMPAAGAAAARKRLGQAAPQRKRSKKRRNALGRLGLAVGGAVGYVLGTRAGRERYDQMVAAAKQLGERPEVKRVVEQAPDTVGQVAGKAADRLGQARERMGPEKPAASPGAGAPPGVSTSPGTATPPGEGGTGA